jgi:thiol-disulfide isomerase/thioredoxin
MSGFRYDTVQEPTSSRGRTFLAVLCLVTSLAILLASLLSQSVPPGLSAKQSHLVGTQAPKFEVDGWLNGPGPTEDELKGKVIVVDAWAWWCGPCRMAAPEMIALEQKYRDQGVMFIGLTTEGTETLDKTRQFLEVTRMTWPAGFGAGRTLERLDADSIPHVTIIDRKNAIEEIVMGAGGDTSQIIENAIKRALEKQP